MGRLPRPSAAGSSRHRALAGLAGLVGLAASLRAVGLEYGLPFATLLNPDEQSLVPRAWRMVHGGGPDPDWFDYPTLSLYLFAPFQTSQDEPSVLAARIVVVVLGVVAVAASWWLGRAAYGGAAGLVAGAVVAVDATHVAYSHMAVTDVPLTAFTALSLALAVSGRLEWAGLAAGLATAAKYPGVFLLVPLLVAGWQRWRRLGVALLLGAAGFVAASPYAVLHHSRAWEDARRVQRLAEQGWLGFEGEGNALFAFVDRLWEGMGPALAVAATGLALALARRRRTDLILAAFTVVYFAQLLALDAHFDRYVLPLVPVLGTLAGRLRPLVPVTLLLLAVPLAWSIRDDVRLTRTDTRIVAERWIRANVPEDSTIAVEPSTPPLPGYPTLALELPGPGRKFDPNRDLERLRQRGVAFVLVTGAVADRVLAARERYPREARFYDDLRRRARRIYLVRPGNGLWGPWAAVYRL